MSIKLPEQAGQWLDEFTERINSNKQFTKEAKDWGADFNGDILFVLEEDPEAGLEDTYRFFFELSEGKCHESKQVSSVDDPNAGFVVRGPFRKWRKIWIGEMDPVQAVLTGEVNLDGDVSKVMQYSQAIQSVMNTALEIDTELPEPNDKY